MQIHNDIRRVIIAVTILHREGDYNVAQMSLSDIGYAIDEGAAIGGIDTVSDEILPPESVTQQLLEIGNDGTFFDTEPNDEADDSAPALVVEGADAMQESDTVIQHDEPRDQAGKQWVLIHDYYGQRRIRAFGKLADAKAAAWEIVAEIAKHAEIEIEDDRAAGDLWGAWDAVCGGEGSLTIDQIDLPAA